MSPEYITRMCRGVPLANDLSDFVIVRYVPPARSDWQLEVWKEHFRGEHGRERSPIGENAPIATSI